MSLLAIILILILFGGIGWGYPYGGRPAYWGGGAPLGGILGITLVVVIVMAVMGRF